MPNCIIAAANALGTADLSLNLEISQSFFFPNFDIPIQFKSQIAWAGPAGFGLQFEAMDKKTAA